MPPVDFVDGLLGLSLDLSQLRKPGIAELVHCQGTRFTTILGSSGIKPVVSGFVEEWVELWLFSLETWNQGHSITSHFADAMIDAEESFAHHLK